MSRLEIITRVERRRRYGDEERAAVLAQCAEPGATVVGVSRRLGISASLIHGWRKSLREAARIASEPLQFIPYGAVPGPVEPVAKPVSASVTAERRAPLSAAGAPSPSPEELVRPYPGARPGGIDIDLPSGVRLSVDSYVNEKALARVLRTLGQMS
ncbi:MAG: transposase [Rhizorhabdus sp.]